MAVTIVVLIFSVITVPETWNCKIYKTKLSKVYRLIFSHLITNIAC